ncbi:hypothetical protein M2164_005895 [Streptomyces sp. SAI-208]|nr:hypothetical protein [Streptomyces sp. SAI-208]MDH6610260.1 hypothetical protein [Streptomyces sp. SAI-208]
MTAPPECDPWWDDIEPDDPRLHDLRGQGLTAIQLHTITDIEPEGGYL